MITPETLYALLTENLPEGTTFGENVYLRDDMRRIARGDEIPKWLGVHYVVGGWRNMYIDILPDGTFSFRFFDAMFPSSLALDLARFLEGMTKRLQKIGPIS